jgi:4-amino-4-deoxy-L-arabinose transferase-like glycosyltransferase
MSPPSAAPRSRALIDGACGLAVVAAAFLLIASGVPVEPEFADEWAYISQSYFLDDLARPNDSRWLEYPAYDLPPLPKYAIGLALTWAGHRPPPPGDALAWYRDTSFRSRPHAMIGAARWPSVVFGALGCGAIYALGTIAVNRRVGLLAGTLLMVNPLYLQQARRAMADVYAEALLLSCAAVGLLAWRRVLGGRDGAIRGVLLMALAGVLGGLAVLSKLNGGLGLMILVSWWLLALAIPGYAWRRRAAITLGTAIAGLSAFVVFVALNPFLTAQPAHLLSPAMRAIARQGIVERCGLLIRHRLAVPRSQQVIFPHNALPGIADKVQAVAVQGFGRFGPLGNKRFDPERKIRWFDSTRRYDAVQDWGAAVWLPVVVWGAVWYVRAGRQQRRDRKPPTAWAILLQALVSLSTVTLFLPLAWDRFFLSIQPGSCLLAAGPVVSLWDRLAAVCRGDREPPSS